MLQQQIRISITGSNLLLKYIEGTSSKNPAKNQVKTKSWKQKALHQVINTPSNKYASTEPSVGCKRLGIIHLLHYHKHFGNDLNMFL